MHRLAEELQWFFIASSSSLLKDAENFGGRRITDTQTQLLSLLLLLLQKNLVLPT